MLWIILMFVIVLHLLFILVLNFFHLFHCFFNDQISGGTKVFWVAVVFLVPFVGSLFYGLFCSKSQAGKNFSLANLLIFSLYILTIFYFSVFGLPKTKWTADGMPVVGDFLKKAVSNAEKKEQIVKDPKTLDFKRDDRAHVYVEKKNLKNKKYTVPSVRVEGLEGNLKSEQWREVRESIEMLRLEVTSGWTDDEKRVAVELLEFYQYQTTDNVYTTAELKDFSHFFDERKNLAPGFSASKRQ